MDWIDHLLVPFYWVRAQLAHTDAAGGVFLLSLIFYIFVLLFAAVLAHLLSKKAARAIRRSAQRLARGAALSDVVRLESSSARIESALHWLGTRAVQSSNGMPDRIEHIPREGDERAIVRAVRWLFRSLWLLLRGLFVFFSALPGLLLTAFGLSVIMLAFCTAFPDFIRETADTVGAFLAGTSWSEASAITAITVGAAFVTIAVVITKILVSEPAAARRSFRRRQNEAALVQLAQAEPAIEALAHAIREQMSEMVRTFEIEKFNAQEWFEWTRQSLPVSAKWQLRPEGHLACSRECLNPQVGTPASRNYEGNLQTAVSDVQAVWSEGLSENLWILVRLVNNRARQGLLELRWCISSSGEFRAKLPYLDEWQRRRINWQHSHLTWGNPTELDVKAGRTVVIRPTAAPETRWLEEDLLELIWDLAELCRGLSDLAAYAHALSKPRRFERVIGATE